MRRTRALRMMIVVVLGIVLAGCGAPGPGSDQSAGPSADGQFPVTITTAFGEVTVPERPQRVVALGWGDAETALSLGVQPVGAADWLPVGGDGVPPWVPADKRYTTPPTMLGTMEVDVEAVAALEPDLILDTRASGDPQRYDLLSRLGVPVVSIPPGGESYLTTWDRQLDMVGKALGKSAEAAQQKAALEAKFQQAAAAHPQFAGKTAAVGAKMVGSYGAYVNGGSRLEFVERLGFRQSPALQAQAGDNFFISVSPERVDLFNADLTVLFPIGLSATEIDRDPPVQAVPSVREGRAVVLHDEQVAQAFSAGTAGGMSYALDEVVPLIERAQAG
ncbi:iron-siderophore ABC transporter substrate-binding protein [Saccharopolyspora rhizosphaerae]|uniref:Iron-siderophore ABC transporter substrate-binding protein n=1 Tax=Saccharopolyspora rhizosphaerae TaxID=2492662 RepID=A0A426K5F7_9PSEU|nr:iron-siderophore ABC transporter substrate-binding protein [Saccharopolyspora rhizosphaerae]RRO20640.1 iron-siderophore ABC transporter substrate-binding protein [Saccharopolyspora rhizosphaerae]